MKKRYSITEARNSLSSLIHAAERNGPITLTCRGRPVAVVVSEADFSRLGQSKKDYWEALQEFRAAHDLGALSDADLEGL